MDGEHALVIVSFESAELTQRHNIAQAVEIARGCNGHVPDDEIQIDDGTGTPTGRGGAVGAWRSAFIGVGNGVETSLGLINDTFETAITWDQWPEFDAVVREKVGAVLAEVFGEHHSLSCRFTHVYTDGPAPYYTWSGHGHPRRRARAVASRQGRSQRKRSNRQAVPPPTTTPSGACTAPTPTTASAPSCSPKPSGPPRSRLDPNGILNPGVLIDP